MSAHTAHKDTRAGKADTLHIRTRQKHRAKAHRELATSFERFMVDHNASIASGTPNERQRSEALNRLSNLYNLEAN